MSYDMIQTTGSNKKIDHNPDIGRKLNTTKNRELGVLLKKFIDGEFDESTENRDLFTSLLKVIAGRLLNLNK